MNLERMLAMCRRDQWHEDQLDWSVKPRPMDRDTEIAVVQYFTDMAAIELLARALFEEQRRRTDDPVLAEIFTSFMEDEARHSRVAARLAAHYDVHRYRRYTTNRSLTRFQPHFLSALRYLSAEIANVYITGGELMLDIALLRSLDDFVADDMSAQAMVKINRDESRHIAIDYYMVEYYASPRYQEWLATQPSPPLFERVAAARALLGVLYHARPFFEDVFLAPITMCDPSGRRLRDAIKRIQLLGQKPDAKERPFVKFINVLRWLYQAPVAGRLFGWVASRAAGVPGELMVDLFSPEEAARAARMSYSELADEALAAKNN